MLNDTTITALRISADRFSLYMLAVLILLIPVFGLMYVAYTSWRHREENKLEMESYALDVRKNKLNEVPLQIFRNGKWEDL